METIIPQNLIEGANNNSFFDRGSGLERDAQNESAYFANCDEIKKLYKILGSWTEEQAEILEEREQSWRALVKEQYVTQANFNASNTPWFIAGPANFNNRRYQKRLDAAENKYKEFEGKKERFIKNTIDMLMKATPNAKQIELWRKGRQGYGVTIAADDPLAVEKMEAHIEYLKEEHAAHLSWNKSIRKNGNADQCENMSDKAKAKINEFLKRCPMYRSDYFCISNETANIRNKSARLEQLKKARAIVEEEKAEGLKLGVSEKEGLRMENNHEAARVQLFFDGKPEEETRGRLKANGFRWSPRFGAWQRQNTPNGMRVAKALFDAWDGEKFGKLNVFTA
jgi:hypothetical protein